MRLAATPEQFKPCARQTGTGALRLPRQHPCRMKVEHWAARIGGRMKVEHWAARIGAALRFFPNFFRCKTAAFGKKEYRLTDLYVVLGFLGVLMEWLLRTLSATARFVTGIQMGF